MKKIYVLMSAACVAVSASAVEKEMSAVANQPVKAERVVNVASPQKATLQKGEMNAANYSKVVKKASKAEQYTFFAPDESIMAIGMSPAGSGYRGLGFASSYGNLVFHNYSIGATSFQWIYGALNDYEVVNNQADWNYSESDAKDLVVKSGIGEVLAPQLYATYPSGDEELYEINTSDYLCGGSPYYWGVADSEDVENSCGITFYQNASMQNPEGYSGSSTYQMRYAIGEKGYDSNGVYTDKSSNQNWPALFKREFPDNTVTNLAIENFTIIQPKPTSTYFITRGWGWINVNATAATQLQSYIYPIDEDGQISDTPIALGYAAIAKGSSDLIMFEYNPLDENGDELEGEVYIDSSVAITIEGFKGNSAIKEVCPVSGFYPFSYEAAASGNWDILKEPSMYVNFSCNVDGSPATVLMYTPGLYYYDQRTKPNGDFYDGDTLTYLCYAQFMTDATFAFIKSVNDEESVTLPLTGGEVKLNIDALYYNVKEYLSDGTYVLTAPEWLTVGVSEPSTAAETKYETTLTISADACEAPGRTGVISIEGLGATYELEVIQGEGGAVDVVVADGGNAQYYDLAGRRVANPDKGIYIKKSGNKTVKVVL